MMAGMASKTKAAPITRVQLRMNIAGLGSDGEVVTVDAAQGEQLVGNDFATAVVDGDETTADAEDDPDVVDEGGPAKRTRR